MEVEVAKGDWRHGSILSLRVGDTRRQVALSKDTRITFPRSLKQVGAVQVDVFAKVVSTRLLVKPEKEVYELPIGADGFGVLELKVRGSADNQDDAKAGPHPAGDGHSGLGSEERVKQAIEDATEYVERYDLRTVLQNLFQQVVKEKPENPFQYMQQCLKVVRPADEVTAEERSHDVEVAKLSAERDRLATQVQAQQAQIDAWKGEQAEVQNLRISHASEVHELKRRLQALEEEREGKSQRAPLSSRRLGSGSGSLDGYEDRPTPRRHLDEMNKEDDTGALLREVQQRQEHAEGLERRLQAGSKGSSYREKSHLLAAAAAVLTKATPADALRSQIEAQGRLTKRDSDEQSVVSGNRTPRTPRTERDVLQQQLNDALVCIRALRDEIQPLSDQVQSLQEESRARRDASRAAEKETSSLRDALESERRRAADAEASLAKARAEVARRSREEALAKTADPPPAGAARSLSPTNSPEVNTHMLAAIVGSSYAAPVPPTTYFEPDEQQAEDAELINKPKSNPELLVTVVDCQDKQTNGTFAWIGDLGSRPLYRLLGTEPRYLYYAEVDPTWAGWWIVDKMGSQDYVEWFKEPHDARLPIYCSKGELGSRVITQNLTREVVQKLALISNHHEKVTIRSKLIEAFGSMITKMEGNERGLMAKTSPVVGIAHALEAQQRAIQLLHSQLAAETQRREAAEAHSQTMEEAFETLQLRLSLQLPNMQAMPT